MSQDKYPVDWKERRESVLQRDNYSCAGCGIEQKEAKEKYGTGLHAHHIKPINEGGSHDLENLIALCQECHVTAHKENSQGRHTPVEFVECGHCGREYMKRHGEMGSFCSMACFYAHRAKNVLRNINNNERICSTCFSEIRGSKTCDNCGNFEPNKDKLSEKAGFEVKHSRLVQIAIAQYYESDQKG